MSGTTALSLLGALIVLATSIFFAGKHKGKKEEQVARAEDDFNEIKEEVHADYEKQMARPPSDRIAAAIGNALRRLAQRGDGGST